jgi:hypothetical protein
MRPRSPDPDDGDARARTLPAGWAEGTLDDGRTYYFNLAKPGAVSFTFPEAAEAQQQSAQAQCVALHAWDQQAGAAADDLMFTSGARIAIVSEEPGQGWLTGRVVGDESGQTGIFPANFVERTAAEAADSGASEAGRSAPRSRTPDPLDDAAGRPRSPDPDSTALATRSPDADPEQERSADAKAETWREAAQTPEELTKKAGAYVYDAETGQWKMNAELDAKQQERQAEYEFYRELFRKCANEVARKQRHYDKGIKSRFRSMAALSRSMGEDASQWTKSKITDARWSSIGAAANVSSEREEVAGVGPGLASLAASAGASGSAQRQRAARPQRLDEDEAAAAELQPRDMVELHGIASEARQHLNGCRGEILEAKGDDGRCPVRITLPDGSEAEKRLRVTQIRRVSPLVIGDTAEVFGLPPPNLLNGAHGTVKGYDPKTTLFMLEMAEGVLDEDGHASETVLRRFEPTNLRRVSSLKVGDQVEVHGITGTSRSLNGCTLYIHRWDGLQSRFMCAKIPGDQLQARREDRCEERLF